MKIFQEIKDSIYNPEYYKSLPVGESFSSAIKYLAKLSLLVSLITIVMFSFAVPSLFHDLKNGISSVVVNYPEDLTISIKNGTASTNRPEPYMIPVNKFTKDAAQNQKWLTKDNILVIDTTKPFTLEQFKTYSTIVWLTKTEIAMYKDSNNQIQIMPLSRFGNWEISKTWILAKEAFVFSILPWLMLALVLLVYIASFSVNFAGSLVMLVLYAFFIWLMAKIKKVELSYKNSYKIGIHAVTLVVIFNSVSDFLHLPDNLLVKLIILIAVIYLNFFFRK